MAKIEDLIAQIPDERLRIGIAAEVKALKKTKKFGLVFEEHLPETVRLPRLPVKPGELVALKRESGNQLWRVKTIHKNIATCDRAVTGYPATGEANQEFPVADLVVVRSFGDAIYPALVPVDRVERGGPDKPWHVLINADNFHALQLLLYCYEGKVDMIYIDPPYNSGARDWKYNNAYVDKTDSFRHSKWLSMIKRRLLLAKRLLKPDGVLVIAIDDYENGSFSVLLDSLFPAHERIPLVVRYNRSGTPRFGFFRVHEYLHLLTRQEIPRPEQGGYETTRNFRYNGVNSTREARPSMFFPIFISKQGNEIVRVGKPLPKGQKAAAAIISHLDEWELWPIDDAGSERCWSWGAASVMKRKSELTVTIKNGTPKMSLKTMNIPIGFRETMWSDKRFDAATYGSSLVQELTGKRFPFPKSLYAVLEIVRQILHQRKDALVLDFFAGSGTTFHATALLNKMDDGRRSSILVTNNEVEEKQAADFCAQNIFPNDPLFDAAGICESITWPRCKAAVTGKSISGNRIEGAYLDRDANDQEIQIGEGFLENIEYFHLDFLNPDHVARGDAFAAVLPILWMMAGCRGRREESKGSQAHFFPKHAPFAVLIKEKEFQAFREALAERKDIEWIYLVTDSEENFGLMRRSLGRRFHCVQLYKSYLENFRINTPELLGEGGVA